MTATVATDLKANLKYYIDKALEGESVIITRPKRKNAVLISEAEYIRLGTGFFIIGDGGFC